MKKLNCFIISSITIAAFSFFPTLCANAWNGNLDGTGTHADIANQTVQILNNDLASSEPQSLRDNLAIINQNIGQLKKGSCYPDFDPNMFSCYQDHFWDPDTGHNFTYSPTWPAFKVDLTADTNVTKFTALAINDWKKGNYSTAVFELGEAMHFTGDLNQPYHAANITAADSSGHTKFESYASDTGSKYLISSLGCQTSDSTYSSAINSTPLSTWITNTDTYFGKIAKNLYYSKSTMSNSYADWDYSLGITLPDAQKNSTLLLYRFLNEVSGKIQSCTSNFNNFQLVIKTSDIKYSGTDDDIYFGFQTNDGKQYEYLLDNPGDDFENNHTDSYVLSLPNTVDAKTITKTWLRKSKNAGDDWMPENIKVIINGYVKQDVTINKWLIGNTTYYMKWAVTAGMTTLVAPSGWNNPYIYVYDDSGASVKEVAHWPGVPMTKSAVDGIYYYTLPSGWSNAKVIFSNNGASQMPAATQPGFPITSSQAKLCSDGTWQDDLINTTRTVTSGMASLVLPSGWNNPYIYVYDDSGATIKEAAKWPGVPMTKSAVDGIYYYTLPSGWSNAKIVFSNNGASQMPAAIQPGFQMANSEAKIYKDGTWQDDAINTTRTVTAGMASFVLPSGWGTPYIYIYDDSGASVKTNATWPGVPMTKSAVDGIYYYTLPSDWSNAKVIFSNNGASQIPGANQPGFTIASSEAKIYKYGTWQDDTINSGN